MKGYDTVNNEGHVCSLNGSRCNIKTCKTVRKDLQVSVDRTTVTSPRSDKSSDGYSIEDDTSPSSGPDEELTGRSAGSGSSDQDDDGRITYGHSDSQNSKVDAEKLKEDVC